MQKVTMNRKIIQPNVLTTSVDVTDKRQSYKLIIGYKNIKAKYLILGKKKLFFH